MTRYVSIRMLCKHTGKHRSSVTRALKLAGVKPERFPGVHGGRLTERVANQFLLKHWPHIGVFGAGPSETSPNQ